MSIITSPLAPGDKSTAVNALQDAMLLLGIGRSSRCPRRIVRGLAGEIGAPGRSYGHYTEVAVSHFQQSQGLPSSGAVDAATAEAINAALETLSSPTGATAPAAVATAGGAGSDTPAPAGSDAGPPRLDNSSRRLDKSTLVSIRLDARSIGQGSAPASFLRPSTRFATGRGRRRRARPGPDPGCSVSEFRRVANSVATSFAGRIRLDSVDHAARLRKCNHSSAAGGG